MAKCSECGKGRLERVTEEHEVKVGKLTFTATIPALRCDACGETYTEGEDMNAVELEAARRLANAGQASGETFRFMRHALGLTAAALAGELGVAPETISRWESGERDVDRMSWLTVASMVTDRLEKRTTTIDRLRALREPPKIAKSVRIEFGRGAREASEAHAKA
jgi:putative zinc finger/helix-turn-helix YgiT family protein